MYSIWKYEIEPDFVNQVYDLPIGAEILSFGIDPNDRLCFWALVDTDAATEARTFACVGTGWPMDAALNDKVNYLAFIGTVTHGEYVWHLMEICAGADSEIFELATQSSMGVADAQSN
jgi:hypothetical protein